MTTADATPSFETAQDVDQGTERSKRPWLPIAVVAVVVTGLGIGAIAMAGGASTLLGGGAEVDPASVYATEVKRGPLVISVTQTGTIKAASQAVVKSEIEGIATVLELVPEGQRVKAGDQLVSLDTSNLEDERVTAEIKVRNDESDLLQANEELAVKQNQAIADVSAAELDLRFAIEDHKKYVEGDFPKDRKEARNKIIIAEAELKRSSEKRRGSERLFESQFISLSELEADRLSERKNQLEYELAKQARDAAGGLDVSPQDRPVRERHRAEDDGLGTRPSQSDCRRRTSDRPRRCP